MPTTALRNEVDGILLVDKPAEWTSHDVINCIKHQFHVKKIGHCGTLDPMATGVLIVLLGKATKLQDALMSSSKVYEGSLRLGIETDTEDSSGNVTAEKDASDIDEASLRAGMKGLLGEILQVPPMVSAIKKNGKPLYELARKGITIEREPRQVTIFSFDLLKNRLPEADFRVHCSKGTYVRTLCADLGRALKCGGIMTALRRTACGDFRIEDALPLELIRSWDLEQLKAVSGQMLAAVTRKMAQTPVIVDNPAGFLPKIHRIAVALGVFDGVHIGHQEILRQLKRMAAETGAVPVVMYFSPHPRAVLSLTAPPLLTKEEQKQELFCQYGVRHIIRAEFTKELASLTPEEFLQRYFLIEGLTVTGFCVGDDWRFGKNNSGGIEFLTSWAKRNGKRACIVPQVDYQGTSVSSTRIRKALQEGQMEEVTAMLGRLYSLQGVVRHGLGYGGLKLNYPTANFVEPELALPREGVYAAKGTWEGKTAQGILYVGKAPTLKGEEAPLTVEVHFFHINENLYDKTLTVTFGAFIRPELKFSSESALIQQIEADISKCVSSW